MYTTLRKQLFRVMQWVWRFPPQHDERREHVEVCPDAGVIIQELSQRIASTGGAALIADYGHDGTKTDTFRVRVTLECFISISLSDLKFTE